MAPTGWIQARNRGWDFLVAALLLVAGCGDEAEVSRGSADGVDTPVDGGTAVIALSSDPDVLNPLLWTSSAAGLVYAEIHSGIMEMADDLTYRPRIAHSWELSADSLAITYHLRPWVWSDGQPLTAHDAAFTFALIQDPLVACPRRGLFRDVTRAEALDDSTLRYTFVRALPAPLERTWHRILPLHVISGLDRRAVNEWPINQQPLSSGPFQLENWSRNRSLTLVRNPSYPGVPARLERVVFRVIPETAARLVALETGEVDLIDNVPPSAATRLDDDDRIRIAANGGRRFYYLLWNFDNPVFADRRTRLALSLAVDRGRMIDTLVDGYGRPAVSPIPPALWNHHRGMTAPPFDQDRARALLAAVGWRDKDGDGIVELEGRPLRFEMLTKQGDPVREQGAVIIRENLAAVGVAVEIRILEQTAGLARLRAGRFDSYFGLLNANLYGDPSGAVRSSAVDQFNNGGYANTAVDSMLDLALGLTDREAALPVWLALQDTLAVDPPAAYLFYPHNLVGISRRLQDVRPHLLSPVNNLSEWWIAPEDRRYRSGQR